MPSFVWRDILTVSVGEMSRAQAFDCTRHFDLLTNVMATIDELMRETDILAATYAPTVVKIRGEVFSEGERVLDIGEGETIRLVLPMTRDVFMALPMSLTEQWITATVTANGWLVDTLKKTLEATLTKTNAPASDSEPSSESTTISLPTPMTGA